MNTELHRELITLTVYNVVSLYVVELITLYRKKVARSALPARADSGQPVRRSLVAGSHTCLTKLKPR